MRCLLVLWAMIAVGAARADPPEQAPMPALVVMGSLHWSDMVGLTQDEIRARLNIKPHGEMGGLRYWESGGNFDEEVHVSELIPSDACADLPIAPAYARQEAYYLSFLFENGRLVSLVGNLSQRFLDPGAAPLTVTCVPVRPSPARPPPEQAGEQGRLRSVLRSLGSTSDQTAELVDAVSELRLGESPPGGIQDWISKHAKIAYLAKGSDGGDVIRFRYGGNNFPTETAAFVSDGEVTSITPSGLNGCLIRPDHSLLCAKPTG